MADRQPTTALPRLAGQGFAAGVDALVNINRPGIPLGARGEPAGDLASARCQGRTHAGKQGRGAPEEEAARFVRLRDEKGFTAFKWRVGAECGRDQDEWPGRTEAVIPVVAKALAAAPVPRPPQPTRATWITSLPAA